MMPNGFPDAPWRNFEKQMSKVNLNTKALLKGKWGSITPDYVIFDLMILVVNINGSQFLYPSICPTKIHESLRTSQTFGFSQAVLGRFLHIHHLYSWIPYVTVWPRKQLRGHDSTGGGTRRNDTRKWSDLFGFPRLRCVDFVFWKESDFG